MLAPGGDGSQLGLRVRPDLGDQLLRWHVVRDRGRAIPGAGTVAQEGAPGGRLTSATGRLSYRELADRLI